MMIYNLLDFFDALGTGSGIGYSVEDFTELELAIMQAAWRVLYG